MSTRLPNGDTRYVGFSPSQGMVATARPGEDVWSADVPERGWSIVETPIGDGAATLIELQGDVPEADKVRLAVDAGHAIQPNGDMIALMSMDGVVVRRILSLPMEMFAVEEESAQRAAIMSEAKQVALGVIMSTNDHDDVLPLASDFRESVAAYLKVSDLLDGFTYLLDGENYSDFQDISRVPMGYKPGPGGYAVAFLDGRVEWLTEQELGFLLR